MQCLEHFSQYILAFTATLLTDFAHATLNTTETRKLALRVCKIEPTSIFKDIVLKTLLCKPQLC